MAGGRTERGQSLPELAPSGGLLSNTHVIHSFIHKIIHSSISSRSNRSWADLTDEGKLTRNEEKEHMQSNNNRLASYIDNVRQLQTENRRMTKQIEVSR
jgi:hypothetical protein